MWALDQQDDSHTTWNVESVRSVLDRASAAVAQLEKAARVAGTYKVFILVSHGDTSQILQTQVCVADISKM